MAEGRCPIAVADSRIGSVVQGRYRILRRIGEGGMGVVYEGEHLKIGRRVAIKTLHAHFAKDELLLRRFEQEARASTAVGNEHIVEVTDMGDFEDGSLYLVLEYLEGSDFGRQMARQGAQPFGRAMHIMLQLCDALAAVHAKGIIHRDLKPDNVFLVRRGSDPDFVKVLDFGISKVKAAVNLRLTNTGAAVGTPYFMAPEQAHADPDIDHRADIYALGGILYFALTGNHPFDAPTYPSLVVQICTAAPPSPSARRPDIPEALEAIILRALAKDRNERFQSAEELKRALLAVELPVATPGASSESRHAAGPEAEPQFSPATRVSEGPPPARLAEPDASRHGVRGDEPRPAPLRLSGLPESSGSMPALASVSQLPMKSRMGWWLGLGTLALASLGLGASALLDLGSSAGPVGALGSAKPTPRGATERSPTTAPDLSQVASAAAGLAGGATAKVRLQIETEPRSASSTPSGRAAAGTRSKGPVARVDGAFAATAVGVSTEATPPAAATEPAASTEATPPAAATKPTASAEARPGIGAPGATQSPRTASPPATTSHRRPRPKSTAQGSTELPPPRRPASPFE